MMLSRSTQDIRGMATVGILIRCGLLFVPMDEAIRQVEFLDSLGLFDREDIVEIIGFFEPEVEEEPTLGDD